MQSDEEIERLIDESMSFYMKHYDLKFWRIAPDEPKIILGRANENQCRFCRKTAPEVKFKNIAHAIPEALGNNTIFTRYECDDCNQLFGNTIENDFGNWFLPRKVFAGLRGKNKYPTFKSRDKKSRIDWSDQGMHVDHQEDSDFFVVDEINKTLQFDMDVPSYVPSNVWKTFIKMGISLVEDEKYRYFGDAVAWLMGSLRPEEIVRTLPIQSYTMPGPSRASSIIVSMLYRNNDYLKLPYAMLVVHYGMQSFQINIPSATKDFAVEIDGLEMPILPLFSAEEVKKYGIPQLKELDLSGDQLVRGEKLIFKGTYGDRGDL
ncbi:HNH endonuclease [Methylobacterium sp. J-088]|uniref:HNH endonuclease n=2 Tax=unclassified Methylobacterium TaxID=2615210 RepID=UPI001FB8CA12|nr:HNH endonuclease [Methylobacterium sp. J-088]